MAYGKIVTVHEAGSGTYTSPIFKDRFRILGVHIRWTSSATVGNRLVKFEIILPDTHPMWDTRSTVNQTAGNTKHYSIAEGFPRETSFSGNDDLYLPLPAELVTPPHSIIKISDAAAVDAADTWEIVYQYEEI